MGFLDRLKGESEEEEAAREAAEARSAENLRRIEDGRIPLAAEARMRELAEGSTGFTSNLSVSDFLLAHEQEIRPIAQVQGSSVYKIGWRNYPWGSWGGQVTELNQLSHAWNEARSLALGRLAEEATMCGCHAVVDVTFENRTHGFLDDDIEIVVTGTAVHLPEGLGSDRAPILTDLSMPDFALLRQAGYSPVGVVAATSVFYVIPGYATRQATTGGWLFGTQRANQELTDYTEGVYAAREMALQRATNQLAQQGGHGMVGMTIDHHVHVREVEQNNNEREDLIVTFHVLGTAIYEHAEHRPLTPNTMIRLNRRTR